jgi:pimeloyl-ACP methyl ester carboxylesterase
MNLTLWPGSLTTVSLAALVGPFLVSVPPRKGTHPAQALVDADSQFFDLNRLSVHIKTWGQGESAFVLLHGFGASLYSWQAMAEPFSELGRVIAYDGPGFGLTEQPLSLEDQHPYGSEAGVVLLIALLDHFSTDQAVLVGQTVYGALALQVALANPEQVKALARIDSAESSRASLPTWAVSLLHTPQIRHLGPLITRQIQSRVQEMIKLAWHDPSLLTTEALAHYKKPLQVDNRDKALWEFTAVTHPLNLPRRMSEITQTTFVVAGDDDHILPTAQSIWLIGELSYTRLAIIENAGQLPHGESPVAFMDAVRNLLNTMVL